MKIGCIEAGGTKFVLAIGNDKGEIVERTEIKTTSPKETMEQVFDYFKNKQVNGIGLGSFGPFDLKEGIITNTPKLLWRDFAIVRTLENELQVPVGFDTDVNAACLGEVKYGCALGLQNVLYITVGTGIGAGAYVNGKLLHGYMHPEMGHIIIKKHPNDDFEGVCPYHKDCLEGLASGPSIEKRYHKKGNQLSENKEVWELIAYYIAQGIVNYIVTLSPEKIIIGGGVSKQKQILPLIRKNVNKLLNNYIELPPLDKYIVPPKLGDNSGIIGALRLGIDVINK